MWFSKLQEMSEILLLIFYQNILPGVDICYITFYLKLVKIGNIKNNWKYSFIVESIK